MLQVKVPPKRGQSMFRSFRGFGILGMVTAVSLAAAGTIQANSSATDGLASKTWGSVLGLLSMELTATSLPPI